MSSGWLTVSLAGIAVVLNVQRLDRRGDPYTAGAIGQLRAIHSAEQAFAAICGRGAYAGSLADLLRPPDGSSSGFIGAAVNEASRGWVVTVEPGPSSEGTSCSGVPLVSSYFARVEPNDRRLPAFAMNALGEIFMRRDGRRISPSLDGAERVP